MELSKLDIDLLLKSLFNPLFDLNKVVFRIALELENMKRPIKKRMRSFYFLIRSFNFFNNL